MSIAEQHQMISDVMERCAEVLVEKEERISLLAKALLDCVTWMEKNHEMPSYSEIIANARDALGHHI